MEKTPKENLIDRLEMRNMAGDYDAEWCPVCLVCALITRISNNPISQKRQRPVMIQQSTNEACRLPTKRGLLSECIRDLKGETEK